MKQVAAASARSVFLRLLEPSDEARVYEWKNNDELSEQTTGNRFFFSRRKIAEWIEDKGRNTNSQIYWAICLRDSGEMIGYISLNDIDLRNRRAYWGGILIGERAQRGIHQVTDAVVLMLSHAFFELGLHKVYGDWLEGHKGSMLLGDLFGFKRDGVLRDHVYKGGRFHDVVVRSLLREEFEQWQDETLGRPDQASSGGGSSKGG